MIYYVEDDDNIRELVIYTLNHSNFSAKGFSNSNDLKKELKNNTPDLFLLDIMLPDEDGLSILSFIKNNSSTKDIPVIMITAKTSEYDTIIGLDSGADDYLKKPFGMQELISRIKAVLRRYSKTKSNINSDEILSNGIISLDIRKHFIFVKTKDNKETKIELPLKCFELLKLFLNNPENIFSRDFLLERIWGYSFTGETRTVDAHIHLIRQKLSEVNTEYENTIETVRGVGYRLLKSDIDY